MKMLRIMVLGCVLLASAHRCGAAAENSFPLSDAEIKEVHLLESKKGNVVRPITREELQRLIMLYQKTLGVENGNADDIIKRAYRKKAMLYHPDKHGNTKESEEKFKIINAAHTFLTSEDYQAYLKGGAAAGGAAAGGAARATMSQDELERLIWHELFDAPANTEVGWVTNIEFAKLKQATEERIFPVWQMAQDSIKNGVRPEEAYSMGERYMSSYFMYKDAWDRIIADKVKNYNENILPLLIAAREALADFLVDGREERTAGFLTEMEKLSDLKTLEMAYTELLKNAEQGKYDEGVLKPSKLKQFREARKACKAYFERDKIAAEAAAVAAALAAEQARAAAEAQARAQAEAARVAAEQARAAADAQARAQAEARASGAGYGAYGQTAGMPGYSGTPWGTGMPGYSGTPWGTGMPGGATGYSGTPWGTGMPGGATGYSGAPWNTGASAAGYESQARAWQAWQAVEAQRQAAEQQARAAAEEEQRKAEKRELKEKLVELQQQQELNELRRRAQEKIKQQEVADEHARAAFQRRAEEMRMEETKQELYKQEIERQARLRQIEREKIERRLQEERELLKAKQGPAAAAAADPNQPWLDAGFTDEEIALAQSLKLTLDQAKAARDAGIGFGDY